MVFTLEDAENDGRLKRETGREMNKVGQRNMETLYDYYEVVCEDRGVDPAVDLGDMVLRALNDEAFAERILEQDVDLSKIQSEQIRKDDIQFVIGITEELDLLDGEGSDPVDRFIERRLENVTSTPWDELRKDRDGDSGSDNERVKDLEREIERLKRQQQTESGSDEDEVAEKISDDRDEIDDLFDDSSESDNEGDSEIEEVIDEMDQSTEEVVDELDDVSDDDFHERPSEEDVMMDVAGGEDDEEGVETEDNTGEVVNLTGNSFDSSEDGDEDE